MAGQSKILVIGPTESCDRILHEEKLHNHFEWQNEQSELGCQIEVTIDLLKNCDSVILVISNKTFTECTNGLTDIMRVLMVIKNLKTRPHSVVLVDTDVEDLPLAFHRLREPISVDSIDKIVDAFPVILKQLEGNHHALNDPDIGNIGQAQAWSNYFGYFDIILPSVKEKLEKFNEEFLKIVPGSVQEVYVKFVELIWMSGLNPVLKDWERIDNLATITGPEFEKWKNQFTVERARYGAKARPYEICVYRIWNKERTKAYVFAGQFAPAGNVFSKLVDNDDMSAEDSEAHRSAYGKTSLRIVNHEKNKHTNDCLLSVHLTSRDHAQAADEILQTIENDINENRETLMETGQDVPEAAYKSVHILHGFDTQVDVGKIESIVQEHNINLLSMDVGQRVLDGLKDNDLLIIVMSPNIDIPYTELAAKSTALASDYPKTKLLVITDNAHSHLKANQENLKFLKNYLKLHDSIDWNAPDFQEQLRRFLLSGPTSLLDKIEISKIHPGLALALLHNYLIAQVPKLQKDCRCCSEGVTMIPKLYELIPKSGRQSNLEEIAEYTGDVKKHCEDLQRQYTTPQYTLTVDGQKVSFYMEFCAPIVVMKEMHESKIAGLLTTRDKHKYIADFLLELQKAITSNEVTNEMVTLVYYDDEKPDELKTMLEKMIRRDKALADLPAASAQMSLND